jgi:hypothetical protein
MPNGNSHDFITSHSSPATHDWKNRTAPNTIVLRGALLRDLRREIPTIRPGESFGQVTIVSGIALQNAVTQESLEDFTERPISKDKGVINAIKILLDLRASSAKRHLACVRVVKLQSCCGARGALTLIGWTLSWEISSRSRGHLENHRLPPPRRHARHASQSALVNLPRWVIAILAPEHHGIRLRGGFVRSGWPRRLHLRRTISLRRPERHSSERIDLD